MSEVPLYEAKTVVQGKGRSLCTGNGGDESHVVGLMMMREERLSGSRSSECYTRKSGRLTI